jgi:hypothetical protein
MVDVLPVPVGPRRRTVAGRAGASLVSWAQTTCATRSSAASCPLTAWARVSASVAARSAGRSRRLVSGRPAGSTGGTSSGSFGVSAGPWSFTWIPNARASECFAKVTRSPPLTLAERTTLPPRIQALKLRACRGIAQFAGFFSTGGCLTAV